MSESCRPIEFMYACPPRRIIGVEMEYHVQAPNLISQVSFDDKLNRHGLRSVNGFTTNGAKIMPDVGHLEYATPECMGPRQAAAADHAGMYIINRLVESEIELSGLKGSEALPPVRVAGSYIAANPGILKTNGYHQNFLVLPQSDRARRIIFQQVIGSYLATRIIWNGCGLVADTYLLSQKAPGIGEGVTLGYGNRTSDGKKPLAGLLNTDVGSADDKITSDWSLLEVRCADSPMSRAVTFASLAGVSLTLRLLEQGIINPANADNFALKDPLQALHELNRNFGCGKFELASGKTITGLEYQMNIVETQLKLANDSKINLPEDEVTGANYIMDTCQILADQNPKDIDYKALASKVEWAAKYCYLTKKVGEDLFCADNHETALRTDRIWHRTDKRVGEDGIKFRTFDPMYDDFEPLIKHLRIFAPGDTRASLRAEAVSNPACTQASWSKVTINGNSTDLNNPYATCASVQTAQGE